MSMTDKERDAQEYMKLVGPFVQSIGKKAGSDDMVAVGRILSALPFGAIMRFFARARHDLVKIESGTMEVDDGVDFEVEG